MKFIVCPATIRVGQVGDGTQMGLGPGAGAETAGGTKAPEMQANAAAAVVVSLIPDY